jgi:hypothetical protein
MYKSWLIRIGLARFFPALRRQSTNAPRRRGKYTHSEAGHTSFDSRVRLIFSRRFSKISRNGSTSSASSGPASTTRNASKILEDIPEHQAVSSCGSSVPVASASTTSSTCSVCEKHLPHLHARASAQANGNGRIFASAARSVRRLIPHIFMHRHKEQECEFAMQPNVHSGTKKPVFLNSTVAVQSAVEQSDYEEFVVANLV